MKLSLAAIAALIALAVAALPASASGTRTCGNATISLGKDSEGGAWQIRATEVSCARARAVAATCVRGSHRGWSRSSSSTETDGLTHVRTTLERDKARVTFEIVGGGGCA